MEVVRVNDSLREENEKEKAGVGCRFSVPKSLSIYGTEMHVNQPSLLEKDDERQIEIGCPIAEIFDARLVISGGKKYAKIHGFIEINCAVCVFERSRLNPQIIHRKDALELTGPRTALQAYDNIDMYVNLKDGKNEFIKAALGWNPYYGAHDRVFCESVSGKKGSARISYVVYARAVVASIQVVFKSYRSVGVCGTIMAYNNMISAQKTVLFSKKRDVGEYLNVQGGERESVMPLLRSAVAVPVNKMTLYQKGEEIRERNGGCVRYVRDEDDDREVNGCFSVDIDLKDFDDGGCVAKGVLEFPIENYEDEYIGSVLSSSYGEAQVKVTFFDLFQHMGLTEMEMDHEVVN